MNRYLLIDVDSKTGFSNLALMKLSAYLRKTNNENIEIDLFKGIPTTKPLINYDKVYVSVIYYQNRKAVEQFVKQYYDHEIEVGGSGWDYEVKLPDAVEHIMPDYSLYEYDYSIGFTSRGCVRKCKFCIVPKKEGMIRDNAPITEFLHPDHDKVILLDNNYLASPKWRANFEFLRDHSLKVNFNQGLDVRLLTREKARLLAEVNFQSWKFNNRIIHLAFDSLKYKKKVIQGINYLKDVGITGQDVVFYVLVGFDTVFPEDYERFRILVEMGVDPYIMRYNQTEDRLLKHFARFVNRRLWRKMDFEDYDEGDSQEWIKAAFKKWPQLLAGNGCPQQGYALGRKIRKKHKNDRAQKALTEYDDHLLDDTPKEKGVSKND